MTNCKYLKKERFIYKEQKQYFFCIQTNILIYLQDLLD